MATTPISNIKGRLLQLAMSFGWGKIVGRPTLSQVIGHVRRRWRLRLLLTGFFWILAIGTALIIASAWLLNHWHFNSTAVWFLRLVAFLSLAGLCYRFFIKPLRRRVSDTSVALYLREQEPKLSSIILSAVDAEQSVAKDLSPQLVSSLVEQSLDACQRVDYGHRVEQRRLRQAAFKPGLALAIILGLFVFPVDFIRSGVPLLLMPWSDASDYSPYRLHLDPGNIEIARGGDQLISARVVGFDADQTVLHTSDDGGASWREITMTSGTESGLYESFIFDLNTNLDYFVKAGSLQSDRFRIDVVEIPAISDISLRYHFPAYTMRAPQTTQGSGDITALRGTRVEVQIKPTIDIPGGELILEGGEKIELARQNAQSWVAAVTVDNNSSYRVALQRASGKISDPSAEFRINAVDDKHPSVSIRSPGRDMKVSVIEEAVMKVRAQDDQGLANLEMVYSVNGEDELKIDLMPEQDSNSAQGHIDAEHTIFLEDLQLRPGDLISYYVQAKDLAQSDTSRTATSDIFFYQVRPFRMDYYQSDQGGGGGGQQGGQQEGFLSEQQKQFVVAMFKMIRDREKFSDETYLENLELLSKAQSRIRDRVEAIIRRIGNRAMIKMDSGFEVVAEELPLAAEAMIEVENKLKVPEINSALSDAQIALKHLQRADAAFRQLNLSLARGSGSGGANNASVEDLANLFRLEMDKLKHQYETVQHGQQQSSAELIDETLERLRELAKRHQQQVEQMMRRQDQAINDGPSDKQQALANELEAMARQLEKLSRNRQNQQLQQSISQMKSAAEAIRRAAGSNSSGASTASGGGIGQARQAAEMLREAQRLLDQSQVQQFSAEVEQTLQLAEQAENKQAGIKQEILQMEEDNGDEFKAQLNQVENHKRALTDELDKLRKKISSLVTSAREQQPEAVQSLKQAIGTTREFRLSDRIQRSRNMLLLSEKEHAIANEIEIQKGISKTREHIETALNNVREQNSRGLEWSLDRMRGLARELQLVREHGLNAAGGQELARIAEQTAELKQRLLAQGVASGDIDPVLAMINQLSQLQGGGEILTAEDLDHSLSALMDLEYRLRKRYDETDVPEFLISESQELPEGYEELVADYYRKLSKATQKD